MPILKDNKEPLVDLKKNCPKLLFDLDKIRIKYENTAFARKTVAQKINKAITLLPPELTLIITDAWRPQYIQEKYFNRYTLFFSKKNPSWNKNRVIAEVKKFVHPLNGKYVSGHLTGGAIDVNLAYRKSGKRLPLNSSRITFQENSLSNQSKLPRYIRRNREIMFSALQKAGFVNYPKEYWHWSYGDIWWAKRNKNKKAIYGVINKRLERI